MIMLKQYTSNVEIVDLKCSHFKIAEQKKYSDIGSHFFKIILNNIIVQTELKLDTWFGRKLSLKYGNPAPVLQPEVATCDLSNLLCSAPDLPGPTGLAHLMRAPVHQSAYLLSVYSAFDLNRYINSARISKWKVCKKLPCGRWI